MTLRRQIANIISEKLQYDRHLECMEHFMSTLIGGYDEEEATDAKDHFNIMCDRIAGDIVRDGSVYELLKKVYKEGEGDEEV